MRPASGSLCAVESLKGGVELVSKPRLRPGSGVAGLLKMITICVLRFFVSPRI